MEHLRIVTAPTPRTRAHIFQFIVGLLNKAAHREIESLEVRIVWRGGKRPETTVLK